MDDFKVYFSEEEDRIFIEGAITFKSVVKIRDKCIDIINTLVDINIDLIKVTQADSSALSLLVSWERDVKLQHKKIKYYNLPQKLLDLGHFNGLDSVLPVFSKDV